MALALVHDFANPYYAEIVRGLMKRIAGERSASVTLAHALVVRQSAQSRGHRADVARAGRFIASADYRLSRCRRKPRMPGICANAFPRNAANVNSYGRSEWSTRYVGPNRLIARDAWRARAALRATPIPTETPRP